MRRFAFPGSWHARLGRWRQSGGVIWLVLAGLLWATPLPAQKVREPVFYSGTCDASAGVALSTNLFAVASDEDSVIRVYHTDQAGAPVARFDFTRWLELDPKSPETDLEGGARLGNRCYWISSHGRNVNGKDRPSRRRFFATQLQLTGASVQLLPVGRPYKQLLADLNRDPRYKRFGLVAAALRAPKARGALNIESLCATPDGQLLIGFRNPIPGGKALLVPMQNPDQIVLGKPARFGDPILLELDGLGLRDMAFLGGRYLIIAGHPDGAGHSKLFEWPGGTAPAEEVHVKHFREFNPEAIIGYADKGLEHVQFLSDDGTRLGEKGRCKDSADPGARKFRSFWVNLAEPP